MSANNCPFNIKGTEYNYEESRKDRFVSFLVPLHIDDTDGLTTKEEVRKLERTESEDILSFLRMFRLKVADLKLKEGLPRFRLFERLLGDNVKQEWMTEKENNNEMTVDQDMFDKCIIEFSLRFMSQDISLDTKEWIDELKKSRDFSVQKFFSRIK